MEAALKIVNDKIDALNNEIQMEENKDSLPDRQQIARNRRKIDLLQVARFALEKV